MNYRDTACAVGVSAIFLRVRRRLLLKPLFDERLVGVPLWFLSMNWWLVVTTAIQRGKSRRVTSFVEIHRQF